MPLPRRTARDGWRVVTALAGGQPTDVVALKDGTVWVVGDRHVTRPTTPRREGNCVAVTRGGSIPVVWRKKGSENDRHWTKLRGPRCVEQLTRVTASAGGSVWVFGTNPLPEQTPACMAKWNGRGWVERALREEVSTAAALKDDEVWTVSGKLYDRTLTQWVDGKPHDHRLAMSPEVIATRGEGELWAAGFRADRDTLDPAQGNELRLARWDGRRWHKIPSPKPPLPEQEDPRVIVTDLVAIGPSDVWVAANIEVFDEEPGYLLLLHWDGAAWSWQRGSKKSVSDQLVPDGRGGFWLTGVEEDDLQHMKGRRRTPVRLPCPKTSCTWRSPVSPGPPASGEWEWSRKQSTAT
ncbi:hypothetical protein [Nonomuraea recticatena]|uniref:hypothetical protein n=1 Tax=Nonomuraea recticatena TaxID=46178 RepID=UPI00361A27CF